MERYEFLASFQSVDSAKYNLQVCIEALIKHGVLDKDKELSIMQMVKFRNRIVHLYQEVDDIKSFIQAVISKIFLSELAEGIGGLIIFAISYKYHLLINSRSSNLTSFCGIGAGWNPYIQKV